MTREEFLIQPIERRLIMFRERTRSGQPLCYKGYDRSDLVCSRYCLQAERAKYDSAPKGDEIVPDDDWLGQFFMPVIFYGRYCRDWANESDSALHALHYLRAEIAAQDELSFQGFDARKDTEGFLERLEKQEAGARGYELMRRERDARLGLPGKIVAPLLAQEEEFYPGALC